MIGTNSYGYVYFVNIEYLIIICVYKICGTVHCVITQMISEPSHLVDPLENRSSQEGENIQGNIGRVGGDHGGPDLTN